MINYCPHCRSSLIGKEMTPAQREFCRPLREGAEWPTHFRREFACVRNDRVHHYECPDCWKWITVEEMAGNA